MITVNDVTQYEEAGILWVEGEQVVPTLMDEAWNAMISVMLRFNEISTLDKSQQREIRREQDLPLIALGDKVIVNAIILSGWISFPITLVVSEVRQGKYCRLEISALKQHFSSVDFLIEPDDEMQCRLRYRQGYYYRKNVLGWLCIHLTLKAREIPETVEIFNTWQKHIKDLNFGQRTELVLPS